MNLNAVKDSKSTPIFVTKGFPW